MIWITNSMICTLLLLKGEAEEMRSELMDYLSANDVNTSRVDASPIKDVHWSKSQVTAQSIKE